MDIVSDYIHNVRPLGYSKKYPIFSQEDEEGEALVLLRYFLPGTTASWYVLEVSDSKADVSFFGIVEGLSEEAEAGYFHLNELAGIEIEAEGAPIHIERDINFTPRKIKEIIPDYVERFAEDDGRLFP